jgi:hypothetical protein
MRMLRHARKILIYGIFGETQMRRKRVGTKKGNNEKMPALWQGREEGKVGKLYAVSMLEMFHFFACRGGQVEELSLSLSFLSPLLLLMQTYFHMINHNIMSRRRAIIRA